MTRTRESLESRIDVGSILLPEKLTTIKYSIEYFGLRVTG